MSNSDDLDLVGKVRLDTSGLDESIGLIGHSVAKIGELVGGAFAVEKGYDFIKDGIEQLSKLDELQKQSEAVIKSTGGAAGVTAEQMRAYAEQVEHTTGIQAENVQQGENMLATFTNIKNGIGAGNDIFSQASKTLTDVAQAMGEPPKDAAIQLGKALNDPIKGITALTRIGVTFSDTQKQQIANFQKAGDTASAQKVILAELNKEFGGSANAFGESAAGKIAKFHDAVNDLKKSLASAVLPTLESLATVFAEGVPKAIDLTKEGFKDLGELWDDFLGGFQNPDATIGGSVGRVTAIFLTLGADVRKVWNGIKHAWDDFLGGFQNPSAKIGPGVDSFTRKFLIVGQDVRKVWDTLKRAWNDFLGGFQNPQAKIGPGVDQFTSVMLKIGAAVREIANFIEAHWKPILIGLGVAFALLVAPVASITAAIIYAYVHFQTFRNVINDVVTFIATQFQSFAAFCAVIWPQVSQIISTVFTVIVDDIKTSLAVVMFIWNTFGGDILDVVKGIWTIISTVIEAGVKIIENIIKLGLDLITGNWSGAWDAFKGILSGVWDGIKGIVSGAIDILKGVISGAGKGIATAASGMWDGIKDAFRAVINWIIDAWNSLKFTTPKVHIPGTNTDLGGDSIGVPQIKHLATGGIVKARVGGVMANIAEGGEDELVSPLSKLKELLGGAGNVTIGDIHLHGVKDAAGVKAAIPYLISAIQAGVGKKVALSS